jgi:predicted nucleic acid-binding protein
MRALLDTSVLIGPEPPRGIEAAMSVASLAELHFGVLAAADDDERAVRTQRLGAIESSFDPLPITAAVAREWGRLAAAVRNRGGQPRRHAIDLALVATANVHRVPLLTYDTADFQIIGDLTDVRDPSEMHRATRDEATRDAATWGAAAAPRTERGTRYSEQEVREPPAT